MNRKPVQSSNIRSIGYDSSAKLLEVEFSSGDIYQYINIPPELYQAFMRASSFGNFLTEKIKGKFKYHQL